MSPKMGPHTPSSRLALETRWVVSVDSDPFECNDIADIERFQRIGLTHELNVRTDAKV